MFWFVETPSEFSEIHQEFSYCTFCFCIFIIRNGAATHLWWLRITSRVSALISNMLHNNTVMIHDSTNVQSKRKHSIRCTRDDANTRTTRELGQLSPTNVIRIGDFFAIQFANSLWKCLLSEWLYLTIWEALQLSRRRCLPHKSTPFTL